MTGSYPPGVTDADIERHFGTPPTCYDCKHILDDCCDYGVCSLELDEAWEEGKLDGPSGVSPYRVLDWVVGHHKDMQEDCCPRFEEAR